MKDNRVQVPASPSQSQANAFSALFAPSDKNSLSSFAYNPAKPASNGRPAATPLAAFTEEQKQRLQRLKPMFNQLPLVKLREAVANSTDFDRAVAYLRRQGSIPASSASTSGAPRKPASLVNPLAFLNPSVTTKPAPLAGMKREVHKSKSIREKWKKEETKAEPPQDDLIVMEDKPSAPKRRLVQAKDRAGYTPQPTRSPTPSSPAPVSRDTPIDIDEAEADESDDFSEKEEVDPGFDLRVLEFLNNSSQRDLIDLSSCSQKVGELMVQNRPYKSLLQAQNVEFSDNESAGEKKRGRGGRKRNAGERIVDAVSATLRGYEAVDSLIQKCEVLGSQVAADIKSWGVDIFGAKDGEGVEITDIDEDVVKKSSVKFLTEKPSILSDDLVLKDYQQVGINWLYLLYKKRLSCILADEMGLGKTCQVISFMALLKEQGEHEGPHLVVVPSSTLENWLREFQKFAPSLVVEPYYGSQNERAEMREALLNPENKYDVIVTTYNLACGTKFDVSFLKSIKFNCCVYDEGHMLKNSQTDRYNKLMRLKANFRLLLTGTPLQNNLRELVSLLAFIIPSLFDGCKDDLAEIFKHKATTNDASSHMPLLSQQRVNRAKTMMTPFILRRKKEQVLKHLPPKTHEVAYCHLSPDQQTIYDEQMERMRQLRRDRAAGKPASRVGNPLMLLRKAALHHLLFRRKFDDDTLKNMSKEIMKEERYYDANREYIREDMEVMSDFELNRLALQFPSIEKYSLKDEPWMDAAKVKKLAEMLPVMKENNDRVLIFSQFTQCLDILESVLDTLGIAYLRLDGQTPVEARQDMIDKYYEETDITVFLLSTKAGGFGINLACANTVIIFDLSFNPHDDKQAEDRAHRVGQTRDVRVIRLVCKGTVEEKILELNNTKLALDKSVSGEGAEEEAKKNESKIEEMLMADEE
ncbi:SWI/SNF-related matrix-associated actin-dependent regulator of chromatin subfamily A containing DEAD/H box 1 [Yarrowia sp. B02]|nr:SWI/SNF-related matrix-associated actin-dependent regulator of chromatin subfamily A containing DEAD/H box 1 [Yarrowia sp. B02]